MSNQGIFLLRAIDVKTRLTAALLLALAVTAAGCASQSYSDDELSAGSPCPRNTTLKCYKRTAAPEECSCVNQGNIEETFENIIGRGPN
jgi:hypothetical protein